MIFVFFPGIKYAMTKWIRQRASGNFYGAYLTAADKAKVEQGDADFYAAKGWINTWGPDKKPDEGEILFP